MLSPANQSLHVLNIITVLNTLGLRITKIRHPEVQCVPVFETIAVQSNIRAIAYF